VVAAQTLRRAEESFEAVLGAPVAGRLTALPTIRELLWVLQRLDRYGDQGRGRPGSGLQALEGLLEGQAWSVRFESAPVPKHLGYFLPALKQIARRWKHTWAPSIKAERRACGVRGPAAPSRREERDALRELERHQSSPAGVRAQRAADLTPAAAGGGSIPRFEQAYRERYS
jgi:hypothetical protein